MKNILSIIVLLLLVVGCISPEQRAKKAVTKYLKENLNDWKSYEPIGWSYYDSTMSTFEDEYKILLSDSICLNKIFNSNMDMFNEYLDMRDILTAKKYLQQANKVADSAIVIDSLLTKARRSFQPSFDGWRIQHKFRAKNNEGNYVIYDKLFHIYSDYSGAKEISY